MVSVAVRGCSVCDRELTRLALLLVGAESFIVSQKRQPFRTTPKLNVEPVFIAWRLPVPSLWLDVLQKIKALGFNAVRPR